MSTSPIAIVVEQIERIIRQTRPGVSVHLVRPKRVAELRAFGFAPLVWSDLPEEQFRALLALLPFRVRKADLTNVRYNDLVVLVGDEAAVNARQQFKERERVGQA